MLCIIYRYRYIIYLLSILESVYIIGGYMYAFHISAVPLYIDITKNKHDYMLIKQQSMYVQWLSDLKYNRTDLYLFTYGTFTSDTFKTRISIALLPTQWIIKIGSETDSQKCLYSETKILASMHVSPKSLAVKTTKDSALEFKSYCTFLVIILRPINSCNFLKMRGKSLQNVNLFTSACPLQWMGDNTVTYHNASLILNKFMFGLSRLGFHRFCSRKELFQGIKGINH